MLHNLILLARPLKRQKQTTFCGLATYETNSHDLSYLRKRRTIVLMSYLRIGFPSMHREEKPSPYVSRPDPKEKKKKKKKKG